MGKNRIKTPNPRDMTPVWEARGYRAESVESKSEPEDPQGEEAYQKAFLSGAKLKPPRVPNPEFYPNSPSAQEYIKKRDQQLFPGGDSVVRPPPRLDSPGAPPSIHANRHATKSKQYPSARSSPSQSQINGPSSPGDFGQRSSSGGPVHSPTHFGPRTPNGSRPPLHLEPNAAPLGPPRMLR